MSEKRSDTIRSTRPGTSQDKNTIDDEVIIVTGNTKEDVPTLKKEISTMVTTPYYAVMECASYAINKMTHSNNEAPTLSLLVVLLLLLS